MPPTSGAQALKALHEAGLKSVQIKRLAKATPDQLEVRGLATRRSAAGASRRAAAQARETGYNRALAMSGAARRRESRAPTGPNPNAAIPYKDNEPGPWGPLLGKLR